MLDLIAVFLSPVMCLPPDFSRDVLPILSIPVLPATVPMLTRKAKLRLDVEADAKREVIVPGKSAESEIIARIFSKSDELMPAA